MSLEVEKCRILVFTMTSWNSKVGANTWESLLANCTNAQIANIYLRDEIPNSKVCSKYFCISENRVLKSIINRKIKTGREVIAGENSSIKNTDLEEHNKRYEKARKKRKYSLLLARELCWKLGKWKTKELNAFIDDFRPDIILHGMDGYVHMNRIVRYAIKRTNAKAIGYIMDDNFTYKQSKKLGYKIYRFYQRQSLKKLAKYTDAFFAITPKTKQEADKFFNINCTVLTKPLNTIPTAENYEKLNEPLKILYTGNLLIGRDKSLAKISSALKEINKSKCNIVLDVYTQTLLGEEYIKETKNEFCNIYSSISQEEVLRKQKEADVLLFLEDLSEENLTARLSFSTKITDYLSSGKCILAIGNHDLAPMQYFKESDSAVIVDDENNIKYGLQTLLERDKLAFYAKNAVECGLKNHKQEHISKTFITVLNRVYKGE